MLLEILGVIVVCSLVGCLVALTVYAIKHDNHNSNTRNTMYKAITKYLEEKNKKQ